MIKTTRVRVPVESIEDRNVLQQYSAMEMAIMSAQGVPPPVGHKIVIHASGKGYEIPQPVTITDARDGPWISLFELAKSRGMIGAQGSDSPPEPAKGMNGSTGAPHEIPVTEEMVAEIRGRGMCAGWSDNVIAEYYRLMRAKAPEYDPNLPTTATILAENERLAFDAKQCHAWNDVLSKENQRLKTELTKRDASFSRLRFRK